MVSAASLAITRPKNAKHDLFFANTPGVDQKRTGYYQDLALFAVDNDKSAYRPVT
jgi:hypothetical protein